jgi:tryptophanase
MAYVGEAIVQVFERRESVRGLRIVEEPAFLRHFTATFAWL